MAIFSLADVESAIDAQAPNFGIDPKLAKAILFAENSGPSGKVRETYDGATTSPKKARGVFQTLESTDLGLVQQGFLPSTYKYNPDDLGSQVAAGLAAMREMSNRQKRPGDPIELATMYNGTTANWKRFLAEGPGILPLETQNYHLKVKNYLGLKPPTEPNMDTATSASQPPMSANAAKSSRITTTSKVFDPQAVTNALNLGNTYLQNGGDADQAMAGVAAANETRIAAQARQEAGIAQTAIDRAFLAMMEATAVGTAAARTQATLAQANMDHQTAGNLYTKTVEDFNRLTAEAEPLGAEIDRRAAVGFYDDPLAYLVNQVRLPGMVGEYNANVGKRNRAMEAMSTLQSRAAAQQSISAGMDADSALAVGRAKAATEAGAAQERLAIEQEKGAAAAALSAANMAALSSHKVDTAIKIAGLTASKEVDSQANAERAASKAGEQAQVDKINNWYKMIGRNEVMTPASYKALSSSERDYLHRISGTGLIAPDFSGAAEALKQYGNVAALKAAGNLGMTGWFENTQAAAGQRTKQNFALAEKAAQATGKVLKVDDHFRQELDKIQGEYQAQGSTDLNGASDNNPLKIQFTAISKDARLAKNEVAKYINTFGPAGTTPALAKVDTTILLDRFVAGIEAGNWKPGAAAEQFVDYFNTATVLQAENAKYALFGMQKPQGYPVMVPSGSFLDTIVGNGQLEEKKLDLTNKAAVENYLTKAVAMRSARGILKTLAENARYTGGMAP